MQWIVGWIVEGFRRAALVVAVVTPAGCFTKPAFDGPADASPLDGADSADSADSAIDGVSLTCTGMHAGLVAYLPFDEGTGTTTADLAPVPHPGDLQNTAWATGKRGSALNFNGVGDRVVLGSPTELDDLPALTACAWVAPPTNLTYSMTIVGKSPDSLTGGWTARLFNNGTSGMRVGFVTRYRDDAYGTVAVSTTAWTHVCTSWDGTDGTDGIALYRNGSPELVSIAASTPNTTPDSDASSSLVVGNSGIGNTVPFNGLIDEVAIFNRVLPPTEIAQIFACTP